MGAKAPIFAFTKRINGFIFMILKDLEQQLIKSYQDFQMSKAEKIELSQLFKALSDKPDDLSFIRNRAFELVADQSRINSDNYIISLKWLKEVIKIIDQIQNINLKSINKAYFSPSKDCLDQILSAINNAKQSIDVCVFTISDDRISESLIKAHQRNINIRILTDNHKTEDRGSDIEKLSEQGLAIKVDESDNHMHHKYAIIDNNLLINGSFNWTRSATRYNQENIMMIKDENLIAQFQENFESLWNALIDFE